MKTRLFKIRIVFVFGVFCLFLLSCNREDETEYGKVAIARVYDDYLYLEDIQNIYSEKLSPKDSIEKMHEYIDKWAKRKLMYRKAELNLPEEQLDVSQQLEEYRTTLLIHKYTRKFINQMLDTVVTDEEVKGFYNRHKNEYKLTRYAVKALFIKIHSSAPNLSVLQQKYTSDKEKDKSYVSEYCMMHATDFDTFGDDWVYLDELLSIIPKEFDNLGNLLQTRKTIELISDGYLYLLRIIDYKSPGEESPQVFINSTIRKILLNMKQEDLINELENELYNDALNHDNLEYIDINKH